MSCSRPWNVPALAAGYLERMEPHPFELRWHLLIQGPEPDPKGIRKVNEALAGIRGGWVLFAADDTIQHPAMFGRLGEIVTRDRNVGAVVFRLDGPGGEVPATLDLAQEGHVGAAQVVFARQFIGARRFNWDMHQEACDTIFVQALAISRPSAFRFVDAPLATFNSLEWKHRADDFVPERMTT